MYYLIKNEKLILQYEPGKWARTYNIKIPNTAHIKGKRWSLKVSWYIDTYPIIWKNLFSIKWEDKIISINKTIRKAINKNSGDIVNVTLHLLPIL